MKFIVLYLVMLYPLLATQIKPKLCIDCIFYKRNFFSSSEFGKCELYPKKVENNYHLVNGKKNDDIEYQFCSIVRMTESKCGEEGKFFVKK